MDLNHLGSLLAAPMASLFLVLSLCAFMLQGPRTVSGSVGMHVPTTRVRTIPLNDCFDGRDIFVKIHNDGNTTINETRKRPDELGQMIAEIMQNRDQRVVYMLPDPDISFGEFADIYSRVASSTPDVHVGLITRQINKELRQCPEGSVCGLDWPDHGYANSCIFTPRPASMINHSPR
ncbi:MAG: hypothetical protein ABSE51_22850 [Terracidiphilus sp.]|jgi:biopolymer transport protein ExbD